MDKNLELTQELIDFIGRSPSCFHVISNVTAMLDAAGFRRLSELDCWELEYGRSYYVTRNGSSLIAFRIPSSTPDHLQLVATHSDSPAFKLKDNPEVEIDGKYVRLNTEKYGSMMMAPWLDRPLSIAGRVVIKKNNTFCTKLVDVDRNLLVIPSLAIHMNRNCNENTSFSANKDMFPLYGLSGSKDSLSGIIAGSCGEESGDIVSSDLFVYNREAGVVWGADNEFVSAPRLDDLMCVFPAVKALIEAYEDDSRALNMCCIFDNEEVGSTTRQGADSTFLSDILDKTACFFKWSRDELLKILAGSFMVSADNAHAVHPNYPEMADATNRPVINGGVVIKFNANQKYTTDAVSFAVFKDICEKAGVPIQTYANRSDIPGGSTLGNISNSHISINTIDVGAPQLAMHSPYETAGVKDTLYLKNAFKAFYGSDILIADDNTVTLR